VFLSSHLFEFIAPTRYYRSMNLTHASATTPIASLSALSPNDREPLRAIANDPSIWAHWPRDMAPENWDENFDWMLGEQNAGRWLLHTVRDNDGELIGQTCYLAIRPEHKGVEIGGTWYVPSVHGTKVNPACKLMLLDHAFDCGAQRVELKTNAHNARSRAAMLKMGGTFEGIHRRHMLQFDGSWRDTAWYSVLADEWAGVKAGLVARLG
jgi:N-acetyltransferase